MPRLSREDLDQFLGDYMVAHIATVAADGSPYVVPGGFLYTGDAILMTPRGRALWYDHIVRDPRVALSIDEVQAPNRKVTVAAARAEILFAPGHETEWLDTARQVAIKAFGDEGVDHYLATTGHVPRALMSIPFEYPSPVVTTWRPEVRGDDLSGMWPARYGIVSTEHRSDAPVFEGWKAR